MTGSRVIEALFILAILVTFFWPMPSLAVAQLGATVNTTASSYDGGDVVTIYGKVTDDAGNVVDGAQVSIQVTNPSGAPVHITFVFTSLGGIYQDQFGLQSPSPNGYYTVYATASKSGYSSFSASTFFVVPKITLANWLLNGLVLALPLSIVFFYPDWDPAHASLKPLGVIVAQLTDWTATGFPYGAAANLQIDVLDTNSAYVDLTSGTPRVTGLSIFAMSGPIVHAVVHYYERAGIAPLRFGYDSSTFYFFKKDGTLATSLPISTALSLRQDRFIIELFNDLNGNKVLIGYGFTWKGTFAAGVFLKSVILPNLSSYNHAWYVFSWFDGNGDGFVDLIEVSGPLVYGD